MEAVPSGVESADTCRILTGWLIHRGGQGDMPPDYRLRDSHAKFPPSFWHKCLKNLPQALTEQLTLHPTAAIGESEKRRIDAVRCSSAIKLAPRMHKNVPFCILSWKIYTPGAQWLHRIMLIWWHLCTITMMLWCRPNCLIRPNALCTVDCH